MLESCTTVLGTLHLLLDEKQSGLKPNVVFFSYAQQTWVVDFIKARVETSFDQEEALEGAMDAFWTFHDLVSDEDFETLATMTSAKVLDAIQFTAKEFKENGLIWRTEIDPDSMSAQLRGISLMSKEQMER